MKISKLIFQIILFFGFTFGVYAQNIYSPEANAKTDIQNAVAEAKKEGKHVLLQIGGNWCPWCIKLHKYFKDKPEIRQLIQDNFIFLEVNYSKENKNLEVMKMLDFPQRFNFPVLVVLDKEGNRIHTQNTINLESGEGYDFERIKSFLHNWRPEALNEANY